MEPITRRKLLAAGGSVIACVRVLPGYAESGGKAKKRFAIARPASSDSSTAEGAAWQQVADDVASDLVASGRFALIETDLSREITNVDVAPEFWKWRSTGAEWLIVGRVTKPDDRLNVSFWLWDVASGQQVLGLYYRIDQEHLRLIPHLIAPAMIQQLSGEHGRLMAMSKSDLSPIATCLFAANLDASTPARSRSICAVMPSPSLAPSVMIIFSRLADAAGEFR
jgi:hypothetical protein